MSIMLIYSNLRKLNNFSGGKIARSGSQRGEGLNAGKYAFLAKVTGRKAASVFKS